MPSVQVKLVMTAQEFDELREMVELAEKTATEWEKKLQGHPDRGMWAERTSICDRLLRSTLA